MSRLAKLHELKRWVEEEIVKESLREARIQATRDQIDVADEVACDAIPARRVRDWAQRKGIPYPTTGRVPRSLRAKYLLDTARTEAAS